MSKSILITGGAGFIGHQVVKEIIASSDWNIYLVDRLSYAGNLNRINEIIEESNNEARKRIKFIYHDLKAPLNNQVLKQIESVNVVLHIGASSHVNKSIQDPSVFIQDNIVGTFNILEASKKLENLELFYYFSTDEVFGPSDDKLKFKEWDRYNSKNPYSATKAAGEELTIAYNNTYSIPSLITHCCNVYGIRQNSEKFIPNTIKKILNREKVIVHTDMNDEPGSRYYLYNNDLSKSVIYLINNYQTIRNIAYTEQKKSPPKINISGESHISNLEIVQLIGSFLNKEFNYILENNDPERPGHDLKYGLDLSLIKKIGGHYDTEFQVGLKKTVDWYTKNKHWLN